MKLRHLSDKNLHLTMTSLAQRERALLSEVLWHLREIDRRKLYCAENCGSLFEYCVKVLRYSEAQASRRVTASRLLKELPELAEDIKDGELKLTQLNQAKQFFTLMSIDKPEDKKKLLNEIKGKTTKQTQDILSAKSGEAPKKVSISINQETKEKLDELRALKAHSHPDYDALILAMAEVSLQVWDPKLVQRNRKVGAGATRYVQVQTRSEVWQRDQGKCQNCGSSYALQLDHKFPYARGGNATAKNLQLLCRNCNQWKATRIPAESPSPPRK